MSTSNGNKRIAVLISGQIRSDDNDIREIAQSCMRLDVDVFLCVWRKRGAKGFGGGQGLLQLTRIFGDRFTLALPRNWIGANMRKVFPKSDHILPDLGNLTEKGLAEIFPGAQIQIVEDQDDLTIPFMDSNSHRMLYMINKCNLMKQKAERMSGQKYDVVARHRPDIKLDYKRSTNEFLHKNKVLLPKSDTSIKHLHDIYWVCSSDSDNLLTSLYERVKNWQETGWHGIHNELYDFTLENNIAYEMYPCATSGLNSVASDISGTQRLTAVNLANAVKNKNFDYELAGGAFFCETIDVVFDAVLNNNFPDNDAINSKFHQILEQKCKPRQKLHLLQALCWLICYNPDQPESERFECLILALSIDAITNNQRATKWAASVAPQILASGSDADALALFLCKNAASYFSTPSFTQVLRQAIMKIGKITEAELNREIDDISDVILYENQNWKWFATTLQNERKFETLILLGQRLLDKGEYHHRLMNHIIRASRFMHDPEITKKILTSVAELTQTSAAYAELGRFLSKNGDKNDAIIALSSAMKLDNTPIWVAAALSNLKET